MNGAAHYLEAERYLDVAHEEPGFGSEATLYYLRKAQVHATLALAAATATQLVGQYVELDEDAFAWNEAAGTPPRAIEDVHLPEVHA